MILAAFILFIALALLYSLARFYFEIILRLFAAFIMILAIICLFSLI